MSRIVKARQTGVCREYASRRGMIGSAGSLLPAFLCHLEGSVDEIMPPARTRDDELSIPRLHNAALSEVLSSDIGNTALGQALRRLLSNLDQPQEAISAFGNIPE
jgi:hypothetical protein